jgi:small subunit ribosomal protein S30e
MLAVSLIYFLAIVLYDISECQINKYYSSNTYIKDSTIALESEYMPTHGSLTKAGKVRGQTPKIEGKPRSSLVSKSRNKNNFIKRFEKRRLPGQKKPERGGRR